MNLTICSNKPSDLMQNIKLIIAYDGTKYLGWQKTSMGPSVEGALQQVLEEILQHAAPLQAVSRTDAGVHARGQTVNFFTSKPNLDLNRLQIGLNSLLPKDISVLDIERMPPSFHPTLDCTRKEYRYYICYGIAQLPEYRFYSWHVHHPSLKINDMREAASFLVGKHHFGAFCNVKKKESYSNYIRMIQEIELLELDCQRLCICIRGNHFLYKMVRNLVGTLVYVGKGKIQKEDIPFILQSQDRTIAGVTAPAQGLFLYQVSYTLLASSFCFFA